MHTTKTRLARTVTLTWHGSLLLSLLLSCSGDGFRAANLVINYLRLLDLYTHALWAPFCLNVLCVEVFMHFHSHLFIYSFTCKRKEKKELTTCRREQSANILTVHGCRLCNGRCTVFRNICRTDKRDAVNVVISLCRLWVRV